MTLWTDYVECLVTGRRHIWFVCQNWIFTFPKMEILIFFLLSPSFLQGRGKDIRWKITIKCDDVCVISKWGIHLCKAFSCLGGTSVEINLKDIEMKVHLWRFQRHCMQFLCFVSFSVEAIIFLFTESYTHLNFIENEYVYFRNKNATDGEKEITMTFLIMFQHNLIKYTDITSSIVKNLYAFVWQKSIHINQILFRNF